MIRMSQIRNKGLLLFAALTMLTSSAFAQEPADKMMPPMIRVTGEGMITAQPDQAQIEIGVVTQAQNAQAAATQNAQKLDAVITELRKVLGQGADIKTINYSLSPNYRYPREGGTPTITGYIASNTLQIKTNDLTEVGKVIDIATQSGANNIQALRFTLKDEQAARLRALAEASAKAKAEAQAIASALGVRVVRVLSAVEGGPIAIPIMDRSYAYAKTAEAAAPPTPVEPGTIDVRATVTLTVEVSQ